MYPVLHHAAYSYLSRVMSSLYSCVSQLISSSPEASIALLLSAIFLFIILHARAPVEDFLSLPTKLQASHPSDLEGFLACLAPPPTVSSPILCHVDPALPTSLWASPFTFSLCPPLPPLSYEQLLFEWTLSLGCTPTPLPEPKPTRSFVSTLFNLTPLNRVLTVFCRIFTPLLDVALVVYRFGPTALHALRISLRGLSLTACLICRRTLRTCHAIYKRFPDGVRITRGAYALATRLGKGRITMMHLTTRDTVVPSALDSLPQLESVNIPGWLDAQDDLSEYTSETEVEDSLIIYDCPLEDIASDTVNEHTIETPTEATRSSPPPPSRPPQYSGRMTRSRARALKT